MQVDESVKDLFHTLVSISSREAAAAIRRMKGWPETGELDFTRKKDPDTARLHVEDQRGLAKAISGFSNSEGGLLIWGVEAKPTKDPEAPDVASGFFPIRNVDAFAGKLNSLVHRATTPVASRVENRPIIENQRRKEGFCLTYVPAVDNPPYRTNLQGYHTYYKRAASSFYEMEPYDIRDVIFRFRYPKLLVQINPTESARDSADVRVFSVSLYNQGPVTLRGFKFVLKAPQDLMVLGKPLSGAPRTEAIDGTTYVVFSRMAVVGFTPRHDPNWIREPLYPGDKHILFGAVTFQLGKPDLLDLNLYWSIHGDDMPPQHGEKLIAELLKEGGPT